MAQILSNTDTSFASPHIPIWIRKKGFSIGKVKLEIMFKKFILPKVDMSWFCLLCMAWMFLPLTAKCNKHFSPYGSFACYYITLFLFVLRFTYWEGYIIETSWIWLGIVPKRASICLYMSTWVKAVWLLICMVSWQSTLSILFSMQVTSCKLVDTWLLNRIRVCLNA